MALRASLMVLVGVLACAVLGDARGQSVTNGKTLYRAYCQVCHSPDPSTAVPPFNLIMTAANNPGQITIAASSYPSQMGFITTTFSASDLADLAAYIGTFLSAPAIVPVVEFYNAGQDHYFISSSTSEIADLDQGVHPGWARTGLGFNAYSGPASTTSPVCRFYIPPAYGDSHFYSASPTECAQVLAKFPYFVYEAANVFYIDLPDTTTGICPTGDIAVYRVWDNRADTNHRYTTSTAVVDQMRGRGWIAEGYGPGPYYPIMCAPQ